MVHDDAKKVSLSTRIVSGTIGALVTSLLVTPLEVVKIRMQTAAANNSSKTAVPFTPKKSSIVPCPRGCGTFVLFNGHMDCVLPKSSVPYFDKITGKLLKDGVISESRRIYSREGLRGLYAGLQPTIIMAGPNTILYYSAYEEIVWQMRQALRHNHSDHSQYHHVFLQNNETWLFPFLSGGTARLISSSITAPLEFLRTRQASAIGNGGLRDRHLSRVATQRNGGLYHEFHAIIRNEGGIGTLYRGLRSTLWRDVPFSAIYWLLLEQFRFSWDSLRSPGSKMSTVEQAGETFLSGAAAGLIAAACTTPFDVAKTRQQTWVLSGHRNAVASISPESGIAATHVEIPALLCKHDGACVAEIHHSPPVESSRQTGTFYELRRIAQSEGLAGLWRGNQARMLKVAPSCAIMLSSYELGKHILE